MNARHALLALLLLSGCQDAPNRILVTRSANPAEANVVLTGTHNSDPTGLCFVYWTLQNVGSATAYHVTVHSTTGDYGGDVAIPPQASASIGVGLDGSTPCAVLKSVSWSAVP